MSVSWGAYSAKPARQGLMRATYKFEEGRKLAQKLASESERATIPIRRAHNEMAKQYQLSVRQALQDQIDARGRAQRPDEKLIRFLGSSKARRANLSGFTVGFIERDPILRLYARNLNTGSPVHVDKVFRGMFLTRGGELVPPTDNYEAQRDVRLLRFNHFKSGHLAPTVVIKKAIPPYHYWETGKKIFLEQGSYVELYEDEFGKAGMDFYTRWFARHSYEMRGATHRSTSRTVNARA